MKLRLLRTVIVTIIIFFVSGCRSVSPDKLQINNYIPDENWRSTYPERVGINRTIIDKFLDNAQDKNIELHNLIIIKNGYLVTNAKTSAYNSENFHDIASVTKSIMALLVGVAINEKLIESEEVYLSDILEEFNNLEGVKVKHLLSMTSGIECINKVTDQTPFAETSLLNMMLSRNWNRYISSLKLIDKPGEVFSYNSINYHILSILISRIYGGSVGDFAMKYLFNPLGIKEYRWEMDRAGNNYGWGSLKLRSLDLARIAYLVSNKGVWGDSVIIPDTWIDKVLVKHSAASSNPFFSLNYGYGWFLPRGIKNNYFAALGRGGQAVFIFPEEGMVVQTFGNCDIGNLLFQIPKLAKGNSSNIEGDNWDNYYGEWSLGNNIFNLETLIIKNLDSDYKEFILKGDIIALKAVLSPTGDAHLFRNELNNEVVKSSYSVDDKKSISIKISEMENINTYNITLKNDHTLNIREHQLLPEGYSLKLEKLKKR